MTCDTCGLELRVGDWPFCPHGHGAAVPFRDDIPGGLTVENYGPHPITFYSHTERRAYMQAHGLMEKEKFCPTPGTDIDPQGIPNPKGYMDAKTLDNARVLIERQQLSGGKKDEEWDPRVAGVLVNEFNATGDNRDAIAVQTGEPRRSSRVFRRLSGSHTN